MMRGRNFGNPTYAPQRRIVPPPPKVENVEQLPPGWTAHIDPTSKKTYYFNSITNVSSWTKPVKAALLPPPPPPPPSAEEWQTHFDSISMRNYYYNVITGNLFFYHTNIYPFRQ